MLVPSRPCGRRPVGPLAAGVLSPHRAAAVPGLRLFPPVPGPAVAVRHLGLSVPSPGPPGPGDLLPPGPEHRPGLHHRHRQYRRGGRGHLSGRPRCGILDVGLRAAGHGHQLCGEAAGRPLPLPLPGRRVAGRTHVLSAGWAPLPRPGRLVRPGLPPRHPGGG